MKVTGDFHTHGSFSHGKGSAMENARAAHEKGLTALAITEHGPNILAGCMRLKEIPAAKAEMEAAQEAFPDVRLYFGVEANLISPDGEIDIPAAYQDEFDVIVMGFHTYVHGTHCGNVQRVIWENRILRLFQTKDKLSRMNTHAFIRAMHRYPLDAIVHLGEGMPNYDLPAIVQAAIETDTCLELNNKHLTFSEEQLSYLAGTEVHFLLGSDAHEPAKVGCVEEALDAALRAGIDPNKIRNLDREYVPKKFRSRTT